MQDVLSLAHRYPSWTTSQIGYELMTSEIKPALKWCSLLQFIRRTIKRGSLEDKKRCARTKSKRTSVIIKKVRTCVTEKNISTRQIV